MDAFDRINNNSIFINDPDDDEDSITYLRQATNHVSTFVYELQYLDLLACRKS